MKGKPPVKGRPQHRAVAFRQLIDLLVTDPTYQRKLRDDFRRRRVHPSVEAAVWAYHAGKPREAVDITFDLGERFAAERDLLLGLSLGQLEALAAESEALVSRALSAARSPKAQLPDIGVEALPDKAAEDLPTNCSGSDNGDYVGESDPSTAAPASTAIPARYHDPSSATDGE